MKKVSRELPAGAGAGETAHANPDSLDTPTIPQSEAESQLPMWTLHDYTTSSVRHENARKNGDDRRIHAAITKEQRLDPVATNKIAQMAAGNKCLLMTNRMDAPFGPQGRIGNLAA